MSSNGGFFGFGFTGPPKPTIRQLDQDLADITEALDRIRAALGELQDARYRITSPRLTGPQADLDREIRRVTKLRDDLQAKASTLRTHLRNRRA